MPSKNSIKTFEENGYYHIYNRGVEKRSIFLDDQDYRVFLSYLKFYLTPEAGTDKTFPSQRLRNYHESIELLSYCLMPNHFHFEVRQFQARAITNFLRSLSTRYSMYFNKRHNRIGGLFQGRYKAVNIRSEEQLIYLSKYIHRNPIGFSKNLSEYRYSSLPNYLGQIRQSWIRPEPILGLFSKTNPSLSYFSFVTDQGGGGGIESVAIDYLD